jgi:hypothetical protein
MKIYDLYQGVVSYSVCDEDEYREPIILEKGSRGVRKIIPQKHCDECLSTPDSGKNLTIYYKTNRGEVAICDYCLNRVQARSGRGGDAFRYSFLGGGFNPR